MSAQVNKVVIVTGSSSGIGQVIALMFASRGAKVTLCGRDKERLTSVFHKLVEVSGGHQDRFLVVHGDLNEQSVRKELIERTVDRFGSLDILVANAGVTSDKGSISVATEESYDVVMDTNLRSQFFLIQQALPHLEKSKGNIINISSITSTIIHPKAVVYSLSKVAVNYLTRCLAVDLGPKGIRVNGIKFGHIPTRILNVFGDDSEKRKQASREMTLKYTPLMGREVTSEDIAEAVAFLVSDAASSITGEVITVDRGASLTVSAIPNSRI